MRLPHQMRKSPSSDQIEAATQVLHAQGLIHIVVVPWDRGPKAKGWRDGKWHPHWACNEGKYGHVEVRGRFSLKVYPGEGACFVFGFKNWKKAVEFKMNFG